MKVRAGRDNPRCIQRNYRAVSQCEACRRILASWRDNLERRDEASSCVEVRRASAGWRRRASDREEAKSRPEPPAATMRSAVLYRRNSRQDPRAPKRRPPAQPAVEKRRVPVNRRRDRNCAVMRLPRTLIPASFVGAEKGMPWHLVAVGALKVAPKYLRCNTNSGDSRAPDSKRLIADEPASCRRITVGGRTTPSTQSGCGILGGQRSGLDLERSERGQRSVAQCPVGLGRYCVKS